MTARLAVPAAAVLLASGCGGGPGESKQPVRLTAAQVAEVERAQARVHAYCAQVGLYLAGRHGPPSRQAGQSASDSIRQLGSLARNNTRARDTEGQTVAEVMGDIAEDLEGSDCSDSLVSQLDQQLHEVATGE